MAKIAIERREAERVALLTLQHESENRLHPGLVTEIMQALDRLERDTSVGALVVTGGDPKYFCTGLDLGYMMGCVADFEAVRAYMLSVNALFKRFALYPKPVVAALNGHAFGAGVFLSAYMDFRFMREDRGWVCLPEVDINIPLLPGMIAICQAIMTPQGFRKLYYTGMRANAEEARQAGFVDAVWPADRLVKESVAFAAELGKKRSDTYAEMKRRIRTDIVRVLDEDDPASILPTMAFPLAK